MAYLPRIKQQRPNWRGRTPLQPRNWCPVLSIQSSHLQPPRLPRHCFWEPCSVSLRLPHTHSPTHCHSRPFRRADTMTAWAYASDPELRARIMTDPVAVPVRAWGGLLCTRARGVVIDILLYVTLQQGGGRLPFSVARTDLRRMIILGGDTSTAPPPFWMGGRGALSPRVTRSSRLVLPPRVSH